MRFTALVPVIAFTMLVAGLKHDSNDVLTQTEASDYVHRRDSKLEVTSSGGCSDRTKKTCTALGGLRRGVILALFKLVDETCPELNKVTISGAAEDGHSKTQDGYSHENGYKVNLSFTKELENCLENSGKFDKVKGGFKGHTAYKSKTDGDLYVLYKNGKKKVYDVTYKSWCLIGEDCNPGVW